MAASTDNTSDFTALISEIIEEKFVEKDVRILKSLTTALREQDFRDCVPEDVLRSLMTVVSRLSEELRAGGSGGDLPPAPLCVQLTAECFRALRNACVQSPRNQALLRELGFIELTLRLLERLRQLELESSEALRCGIQFLGNMAVGNQGCKDHIWRLSFPQLLLELLSVHDDKAVGYASMVLHTCLDPARVEQLAQCQNLPLACRVMELCRTQPELDWTVLIATQHFLQSAALVENMYMEMTHLERMTLLELVSAQLGEEECGIPPSVARFLASRFQKGCRAVLSLATRPAPEKEEEGLTMVSLLNVLCEMTSDHRQFMFLQDHPDLLKTTIELLQQVHTLGKTSTNVFSAAQDFSNFFSSSTTSSSTVSFKAHLIRLIGNLCHSNTGNQNMLRSLDGIPLILDNCSIDSNNPFISQWAVFTIRNLLDHNPENQEVVAALERRGVGDDSALRNLGFRLEERDGTMLLKPVNKDN